MDDDGKKEYRWESGYEKTWESIRENEDGLLDIDVEETIRKARRNRFLKKNEILRLGVMRHLYIVVDFSENMLDQDLKPNRHLCTVKLLEKFIVEYFDQNPISQIGIIVTKNKQAEKLTDLSGTPKQHIAALQKANDAGCAGEPSLFNALNMAAQTLKNMPSYSSREVLVILGSLTTCDPDDIHIHIQFLKKNSIRCSVLGLSAELRVCTVLSKETGGSYGIILDDIHYKDLLFQHLDPPPATSTTSSSLIRMGFPSRHSIQNKEGKPSMCMCHIDTKSGTTGFGTRGYFCPQCKCKYCELPTECKACGLTLVSAPHLARSYHHFFPLDCFKEVTFKNEFRSCFSCCKLFTSQMVYQCEKCQEVFCYNCDQFIHDTLHTCPGCASSPKLVKQIYGTH